MSLDRKRILEFAVCGAAIGALGLFFFGEGLAMAFYLAFEGAIMGLVIGGVIGLVVQPFIGKAITKKRYLP
jgi:membrane associated rhomboid family serine protease